MHYEDGWIWLFPRRRRTARLHSRYGTADQTRNIVFILFGGFNLLFRLKLIIYCPGQYVNMEAYTFTPKSTMYKIREPEQSKRRLCFTTTSLIRTYFAYTIRRVNTLGLLEVFKAIYYYLLFIFIFYIYYNTSYLLGFTPILG